MSLTLDLDSEYLNAPRKATRTESYPRLRYMGSKYRVVPQLIEILSSIPFDTALDGFSGSGVVSYALKEMGKQVHSNDFLEFPATISSALTENEAETLQPEDLDLLLSPNADGRDFICRTFAGLYFPIEDHQFLDAVWSHLDQLSKYKRALAIAALCLAAARKQPRGVFTITDFRYDDGRRNLRMPLRDLFHIAVKDYNNAVFSNGRPNTATSCDIFEINPDGYDLVYFDPPYAPPKDDSDYIKRYHFLEGLCKYWQGETIMENTSTKKIMKRFTPFAYKRTIREALRELFHRFRHSVIVLSYSSNSVPDRHELFDLISAEKRHIDVYTLPHRYSFGTHATAVRRSVHEYIFVAR